MITSNELKTTISAFKTLLKRYYRLLKKNPDSVFYSGLVKNTKELIADLKNKLKEIQIYENKNLENR